MSNRYRVICPYRAKAKSAARNLAHRAATDPVIGIAVGKSTGQDAQPEQSLGRWGRGLDFVRSQCFPQVGSLIGSPLMVEMGASAGVMT